MKKSKLVSYVILVAGLRRQYVSFEWISANLDQISLYVGLSIFAKRVSLDEWKEKIFFAFVFPLGSGLDILTRSYAVQTEGSSFILRNDIQD